MAAGESGLYRGTGGLVQTTLNLKSADLQGGDGDMVLGPDGDIQVYEALFVQALQQGSVQVLHLAAPRLAGLLTRLQLLRS